MAISLISKRFLATYPPQRPLILMYHSISSSSNKPDWRWSVSLRNFNTQLDILASFGFEAITVSQLFETVPLPSKAVVITFDDGYADNQQAYKALLKRNMKATWYVVSNSIDSKAKWSTDAPASQMLSAIQLKEYVANGMEVGSHSHSHQVMTLLDTTDQEYELRHSKELLEDIIAKPVTSFCYPYGEFDEALTRCVRSCGYTNACTTQSGWALASNEPFEAHRISIFNSDTPNHFAKKLAFADNDINWRDLIRYTANRVFH
jgi:peptidoglycan/xylan/chitin deacetylase (PgdA/CDA1 family)